MGTVALACRLWTWCLLPAVTVQKACPLVLSPQALATALTEKEGVKLSFYHGPGHPMEEPGNPCFIPFPEVGSYPSALQV